MRFFLIVISFCLFNISFAQKNIEYRYWIDNFSKSYTYNISDSCNFNIEVDVSHLKNGIHSFYFQLIDKEKRSYPIVNSVFYKIPIWYHNSDLTIKYTIDNDPQLKTCSITKGSSFVELNLGDISNGIHVLSYTIIDSNGILFNNGTSLFIKYPNGGCGICKYEYWLNEDEAEKKEVLIDTHDVPFKIETELLVKDFNVKNKASILINDDNICKIYPLYNLNIRFYDTWGFVSDTTSTYIDCSKEIEAISLKDNEQYDLENADCSTSYWFKIKALQDDSIMLKTRRNAKLFLYDPSAMQICDTLGNNIGFEAKKDGTYYLLVKDISESTQTFSLKYKCISGPSQGIPDDNNDDNSDYDGILIDWINSSEWADITDGITLNKNGFIINICKSFSNNLPYITTSNNLRIQEGAQIQVSNDKYIEKLIFCLTNKEISPFIDIKAEKGNVWVDTLKNAVIWEGPSPNMTLSLENKTSVIMPTILSVSKIYAVLSNIDKDNFMEYEDISSEITEYQNYNTIILWYKDNSKISYFLNDNFNISFEYHELIVHNENIEARYNIENIEHITFEYQDNVTIEYQNSLNENIVYLNNAILFEKLPANTHLSIYNISGVKIFDVKGVSGEYFCSLSSFDTGVYILSVNDITCKFIIR